MSKPEVKDTITVGEGADEGGIGEMISFCSDDILTLQMYGYEIHDLQNWIKSRLKNRASAIAAKKRKHDEAIAAGKKIATRQVKSYKKYPEIRILSIESQSTFLNTGKKIEITNGPITLDSSGDGDGDGGEGEGGEGGGEGGGGEGDTLSDGGVKHE